MKMTLSEIIEYSLPKKIKMFCKCMSFINSSFLSFTYKIITPLSTEHIAYNIYTLCEQYYTNPISHNIRKWGHSFSVCNCETDCKYCWCEMAGSSTSNLLFNDQHNSPLLVSLCQKIWCLTYLIHMEHL